MNNEQASKRISLSRVIILCEYSGLSSYIFAPCFRAQVILSSFNVLAPIGFTRTHCIPRNIDWQNEKFIHEEIAKFDVGVATLLDTEMHRSKSSLKAKQYLNCGVPVLSSDLPENNRYVKHGYNGFLCKTSDEFRNRIIQLYSMSEKKYTILSQNARRSTADFSLKNYCDTMLGKTYNLL